MGCPVHILCDMDGTIIDTEELKCTAWRLAVAEISGNEPDTAEHEAYYAGLTGMPGPKMAVDIIRHYQLATDPEHLHNLREKYREQLYGSSDVLAERRIQPVIDVIRSLKDGQRVLEQGKTILVTTAGDNQVDRVMAALGIRDLFDGIISGLEKSIENPACYRSALDLLEADPGECLALEDTRVGYDTAQSLGIPCLFLPNRFMLMQDT